MAVNVRVNQSALELLTLGVTDVRVCQSVIEFITSPITPPYPVNPLRITLRGVKVVKHCAPDIAEVPQLPSVPRVV